MWSKISKRCLECKTTKRNHAGKGKCTTCYSRFLYKTNPKRREQCKRSTYKWMKEHPEEAKKIQKKAMAKYLKKQKQ